MKVSMGGGVLKDSDIVSDNVSLMHSFPSLQRGFNTKFLLI